MFKKLKDKLTEEVKIPSQKFTQSMQQLAQAVVSPASSNNAAFDSASNDNFSIDGEFDDTPQNSPIKKVEGGVAYRGGQATPIRNSFDAGSGAGFTHVDLQQDTSTPNMPSSLRSSISSLTSDSSFMFPVLESSGPTYNFQSDLESCSEASESVGPNINKEQLLIAYQKIQQKYHKYKGRYADLARHYRDLERDNKNAKHILTECQDKALRRMTELKEQCNLEKQAKAHLEEALRSDLEEKDHLIHTLKTKIKLLRNQGDQPQAPGENSSAPEISDPPDDKTQESINQEDLLTGGESGPSAMVSSAVLTPEPASIDSENALKEKLKKLESLLHKCKEDITNKRENIKQLEADKLTSTAKIEALQQQLITIQKREEEASLSLAKNKQTIHLELESKEDEIKKLNMQLASTNNKVSELQAQVANITDNSKKELAASKAEAKKLFGAEMEELLGQKSSLEDRLAALDSESKSQENRAAELQKRLNQLEKELNPLKIAKNDLEERFDTETYLLKEEVTKLQNQLRAMTTKEKEIELLKPVFNSVKELSGIHKQLKNDVSKAQTDILNIVCQEIRTIETKIEAVVTGLTEEQQKVRAQLEEQTRESLIAQEALAMATEKSEEEGKITELYNNLKEAGQEIVKMRKTIESERTLRQSGEEESSHKLTILQKELDEERHHNRKILEESMSCDSTMRSRIEQQSALLKEKEQDYANLAEEYEVLKARANTLQISSDQLQQELDFLKTRDRESMNELTSMQMLLNTKNAHVENLESVKCELESNLNSVLTEKDELEQKLRSLEAELLSKISDLKAENQEAYNTIKELQEKDIVTAGEILQLTSLQNKIVEKEKQIVDLKNSLTEAELATTANIEFQSKLEDLSNKCQEKDTLMSRLKEENERLMESVHRLESCDLDTSERIQSLQNSNSELEKALKEKLSQLSALSKAQDDLLIKTEELKTLSGKLTEAGVLCSNLQEMLQSKSDECTCLTQNVEKLCLNLAEAETMLQGKQEECENLMKDVQVLQESESRYCSSLEEKVKEIENHQMQLSNLQRQEMEVSEKLKIKERDCEKLIAEVSSLNKEKFELATIIDNMSSEIQVTASQLESVKKEFEDQSKTLEEQVCECNDLLSKLNSLTVDNEKTVELLKQREIECEEKEAQLDNLADEMKRVEELSNELHRINDDRDANVEVLSTEASSLAQKVEELTITTQELKEREVDLLGKLEVAQDLEAEYISMKQREEILLLKLNEAKSDDLDMKTSAEELLASTEKIKELEEENMKLKAAGKDLHTLINRAKEAELKCKRLTDDGAGLLLRIQKAEESELRCSLLEEELEAIKRQKSQMSQEIETLQRKSTAAVINLNSDSSTSLKEPVAEEPCVIKRYANLTESEDHHSADGGEWKGKYHQLLEQHEVAMQESVSTITQLKEENLLAASAKNIKLKERLWDRDDSMPPASEISGSANGSFSTVENLQQQLASITSQLKETKRLHRQEVDDLRRILLNHGSGSSHTSSRSDNLEDATELEYLRNILYEYMMGKEPMILARVIAAVVKFDADQTNKVLQKEQQRLSLLGHLGIS